MRESSNKGQRGHSEKNKGQRNQEEKQIIGKRD